MNVSLKISAILLLAIMSITTCTSLRRGVVSFFSFDDLKKSRSPANESLLLPVEPPADQKDGLALRRVATGFESVTDMQFLPDESDRAVVLEKTGTGYLLDLTTGKRTSIFKVDVATASELGLLGIAFHPDFKKTHMFYVHYNPRSDLSRVSEWKWLEGLDSRGETPAVTKEVRTVLEVDQPYQNHNGGSLVFGPDKMLYIGFGDGGWRGDPENRAQNLKTLLGKMLRIDVNQATGLGGRAYGIPKDNPFVGNANAEPEIFAFGLRNPWKYSFDALGRLIAADVGQDKWEEVSIVPAGGNMGWRIFEGLQCYGAADLCDAHRKEVIPPMAVYDHAQGASVTGGYQYQGKVVPRLAGRYLFGDFISGRIWSLELPEKTKAPSETAMRLHGKWDLLISTFARDNRGEIYIADFSRGGLYQVVTTQ